MQRNLLLWDIATSTLMRCSEIVQIRVGDIDLDNKAIAVRGKGGPSSISGERNITDTIAIHESLVGDIHNYINHWRHPCKNEWPPMDTRTNILYPEAPLFTTHQGRRISINTVNRIISQMIKASLKPQTNTFRCNRAVHCIRRSMATLHMEKGVGLEVIQAMLRHEHIETTMRYLEIKSKRVEEVFLNSPLLDS